MKIRIAEEARDALRRHVLEPLVPRCMDAEYGGFLVDFDQRWQPVGPHEKTLEHASRTTLSFAQLEAAMPGEGCDRLVRHGCAFLQAAMWDAANGGFFARVDRSGRPCWDGLKHPHAVTYAALAFLLAEPYLPPGEGRLWACRAQQWLDEVAWDPMHGGYWGSYRRDNERYLDDAHLPTPHGLDVLGLPLGVKESNTLGDAIDTLTILVAHGMGEPCRTRLVWLVNLVADRLSASTKALPYQYRRDWQPVSGVVHLGLQFQMVHRLLSTAAVLGEPRLLATSRDLANYCLERGRHPRGGFCFAVSGDGQARQATGMSNDVRHWWVQFEAVRLLHALAINGGIDRDARDGYRRARDQQWVFVRERFFDQRYGGIREFPEEPGTRWYNIWRQWLRPPRAIPPRLLKTHGWKDPFHEIGAFLALQQPIEEERIAPLL